MTSHLQAFKIFSLTLGFTLLLPIHCAQKEVAPPPPPKAAAPASVVRAERGPQGAIESRIQELLDLAQLTSVRPIVNEETGFVQLYGPVPDAATRETLLSFVGSIRGVRNLQHDLHIAPGAVAEAEAPAAPQTVWGGLADSWFHLFSALVVAMLLVLVWRSQHSKPRPHLVRTFPQGAKTIMVLALILLAGCKTSPTGRKQIALLPDQQLRQMGATAFEDLKKKMPVNQDPETNAYVRCIAREITAEMPKKQDWEIVVFENEKPNAFALPGGKIGVHTGMLKVAKDPAQLAAVIGHEVAHVTSGHANERVSEELLLQGGLALATVILSEPESTRYRLTMAALGLGAQYGIILPHSRRQEREADIVGLRYMAKAGFDPRQSVNLWENMRKAGGPQPPEFLSTHPSYGTRIESLQENIPEALATYDKLNRRSQCLSQRLIGQNRRIL